MSVRALSGTPRPGRGSRTTRIGRLSRALAGSVVPIASAGVLTALVASALNLATSSSRRYGAPPSLAPRAPQLLELAPPSARMLRIPGGHFVMGSTASEVRSAYLQCLREPLRPYCKEEYFHQETPQRTVSLDPFYLDRFEVSLEDFQRCVHARRCLPPPYHRGAERLRQRHLPATMVSWHDARTYCAFRRARLPSEAEFEWAAAGAKRRRYPWGPYYNPYASNHGQLATRHEAATDGYLELAPVGSFPAGRTPEGVEDLAGNVAEWVQDSYSERYPAESQHNPKGPDRSTFHPTRVVRGGHFRSSAVQLRSRSRDFEPPLARLPTLGFRCARSY